MSEPSSASLAGLALAAALAARPTAAASSLGSHTCATLCHTHTQSARASCTERTRARAPSTATATARSSSSGAASPTASPAASRCPSSSALAAQLAARSRPRRSHALSCREQVVDSSRPRPAASAVVTAASLTWRARRLAGGASRGRQSTRGRVASPRRAGGAGHAWPASRCGSVSRAPRRRPDELLGHG